MNLSRAWVGMATVVCSGVLATPLAWTQKDSCSARAQGNDRVRTVMVQALPTLDGNHLKAVLVEVRYGPSEASTPHSHPCAVVGYVVSGSVRTQVQGQPETIYKAGQSFYEAPNGVHLVSANASSTEPAKLLAYLICDHDAPLSIDVPQGSSPKGVSR